MHSTVLIALGGNLGDVARTFDLALQRLSGPDIQIAAVSRYFESPPMGHAAGGTFLNAAATLKTTLEPESLLDRMLEAEDALGRVRAVHWGPRPIDLDLVLWGDRIVESSRLKIPHAGMWYRRFVLDPLADIASDTIHPETGESIGNLRERLMTRPLPVAVTGGGARADALRTLLHREFSDVAIVADDRPALVFATGTDGNAAARRTIVVPPTDTRFDLPRAVLSAALGVPRPLE